jgi:hypothetical protein
VDIGKGRREFGTCSLLISGDSMGPSGGARLEKADMNKLGGLSFDPARLRLDGGGGKTGFEAGSGDGMYTFAGDSRVAGDIPEAGSSTATVDVR